MLFWTKRHNFKVIIKRLKYDLNIISKQKKNLKNSFKIYKMCLRRLFVICEKSLELYKTYLYTILKTKYFGSDRFNLI